MDETNVFEILWAEHGISPDNPRSMSRFVGFVTVGCVRECVPACLPAWVPCRASPLIDLIGCPAFSHSDVVPDIKIDGISPCDDDEDEDEYDDDEVS